MSKKAFIAVAVVSLILSSLAIGMQAVEVAKANPTWGRVPDTANQDKPILVIESPGNYTDCISGSVILNFTIIKPSSWNWTLAPFGSCANGNIQSVNVSLNGIQEFQEYLSGDKLNGGGYWNKSYSLNIEGLNFGINSLTLIVLASTQYISKSVTVGNFTTNTVGDYQMNVTDTVYVISGFSPNSMVTPTLSPSTPSPSPTPTFTPNPILTVAPSRSLTLQPTPEPSQTPDRLHVGDFAPIIIPGSMIFLAIIAVGLLIYFGKRRG